jgi:hypothetical protein
MPTHDNLGPRRLLIAGALLSVAALSGGCSLLFHVDAEQCSSNSDCVARGLAFATSTCQAGTCVLPEAGVVDASSTADGSGEAAAPTCTTTKDCMANPNSPHQEVACDPNTNTCLQLTTDECGVPPIGDYTYSKGIPPIFLGAFATIPQGGDPTSDVSYQNYKFAIGEFTTNGGIPAGPGGALRMPVAVVCNNLSSTVIDTAMTHLANDVHVAGVVTAFDSVTLSDTFSTYGYGTAANFFMVNPFGVDSNIVGNPQHQLWHMLGAPGDVATAYQALLPRLESYMRGIPPWKSSLAGPDGGTPAPLRVATVTGNARVLNDLASAVTTSITWNFGQTVQENQGNYQSEALSGSVLNGDSIASMQSSITMAVNNLLAFQPDVVISFASDEFITVLEEFDAQYVPTPNTPPPVYVLSPYNAAMPSDLLTSWIGTSTTRAQRVFGVDVASSTDTSVLNVYNANFVAIGGNSASDLGAENYYDAMYFAVDSLVAGIGTQKASGPLQGADLGAGMLRLIATSGTPLKMGSTDMGQVFTTLTQGNNVYLDGTLGPPFFSPTTEARVTQGDIYCATVNPPPGDGGAGSTVFVYDQMRLAPPDGGAPSLTGTPCAPGF